VLMQGKLGTFLPIQGCALSLSKTLRMKLLTLNFIC